MNVKQAVITQLIKAEGGVISGQEIAKSIDKSRVAVRKAIVSLSEQGFEIVAEQSNGYRLVNKPDVLIPEYIASFLPPELSLFYYEEIDSTNSEAKRLLSSGNKAPFIVVAKEQKGGRGRRGRVFSSPIGGIYFSLVLPTEHMKSTELVTTASALAVCKALEEVSGETLSIKWVNDVYYKSKKLVGILTEGVVNMELGQVEDIIIGIGINYEIPTFNPELKDIAISLYPKGKAPLSRAEVLGLLVKALNNTLASDFLSEYKSRCFVLNKPINVIKNDSIRPSFALDLDEKAHLVVKYENGEVEHLSSGEVTIRLA
ncbi:MAG: biotin--[acetyl-CoA-carboxylase] ligase [Spirochaetales bacterium]|nr:biotin--[acetyl-CoA-carboxylase] ligase [Spirochaetales bacterium]